MKLLQKLAVGFRSVLTLSVILGSFLNTLSILHQSRVLPSKVCLNTFGKGRAISEPRQGHTFLALILSFFVLVRDGGFLFTLEEEHLSNAFIGIDLRR